MQKPVISALAALALVLSACGTDQSGAGESTSAASIADPTSTTVTGQTTATVASSTTTATTVQTTTTTAQPSGVSVEIALLAQGFDECVSPDVVLVDRVISGTADPMFSAFDLLVSGPTDDEEKGGAASWFAEPTAGTVRSVILDIDLLVVEFDDFRETISNASTTCGSEALLAQLNATAFQFADVQRVTYQIDGSCDTFFNWLQRDCQEYSRA